MGLTDQSFRNSFAGKERQRKLDPLGLAGSQVSFAGTGNAAGGHSSGLKRSPRESKKYSNSLPEDLFNTVGEMHGGGISSSGDRIVNGLPTKLNIEKQGKHIPGSSSYIPGRSILEVSAGEAQELVNRYAGTGQFIGPEKTKERIDFGRPIGMYVDPRTGRREPTTIGIVHYSKNGTHIVPAAPKR